MNNFVKALTSSLDSENWYGVLFICLTIPDICGKVEYPQDGSQKRTVKWFDKYLKPQYTHDLPHFDGEKMTKREHVFLGGKDFYALRCALLHEGVDDISGQSARTVLNRFSFVMPGAMGNSKHCNQYQNGKDVMLELQVDNFGREILSAINAWMADIAGDVEKMSKIQKMLTITFV